MATRYWVSGSGTWNSTSTANWSATSGGTGGASAPTSVDNVVFDAGSDVGAIFTVTTGTSATCADFTIGSLDFTMTLAGSAGISVYGSLSYPATRLTTTHTGALTFRSATTGKTINTNGRTLQGGVVFDSGGGGWTLTGALALSDTDGVTLTNGSFSTGGFNLTCGSVSATGTTTRSLSLGASVVTINGITPTFQIASATGLTFTAGTSSIVFVPGVTSGAVPVTLAGAGVTFYDVSINTTRSWAASITGANTFNNLTLIPNSSSTAFNVATFGANQTVNGTLTATGLNVNSRIFLKSDARATARTLTVATMAASTDIDFYGITAAGASAPWSGARFGNCQNNTSITFPAAKTVYYSVNNGWSYVSWALTSGGVPAANNLPLAQDTAIINNATTGTITCDVPYNIGTFDASARTTTTNLAIQQSTRVFGNWTNGPSIAQSGVGQLTFSGYSTNQLVNAGANGFNQTVYVETYTAAVTLVAAAVFNGGIALTTGTFNSAGFSVTADSFITPATGTCAVVMGASTWTLNSTGPLWGNATVNPNFTVTAGTSTIVLANTSTTSFATFFGGNKTYNNLVIGGGSGTATMSIYHSNTFNTISSTRTASYSLSFDPGITTTVANFTVSGSASNTITIGSIGNAATHTLTKTGGGTINVSYLNISYSNATPAATWYATNTTNGGNNTGWNIAAPANNGKFFFLF